AADAAGLAIHGPSRLLHLAPPEAANALAAGQPWRPASLEDEGFVHLSFEHQVAGSLAAHFTGQGPLALLELRPELLAAPEVLLELSRGGAPFPHLYRELRTEDLLRTFEVPVTPEGGHQLPAEASLPAPG
ncbi:MAG: DUF952 domain-containing protein, partial [Planctomycetota bacterium]|nr:DUF952 domain-containing protein [Planctomycetota bacterium]